MSHEPEDWSIENAMAGLSESLGEFRDTTGKLLEANEKEEKDPRFAELAALRVQAEAAKKIGIKVRSLRTERIAGRIGHKRVAGKVMYRERDIERWFNEGEEPWHDRTEALTSDSSRREASITSAGAKAGAAGSAARAQKISQQLKGRSRPSSDRKDGPTVGHVIQPNFRS